MCNWPLTAPAAVFAAIFGCWLHVLDAAFRCCRRTIGGALQFACILLSVLSFTYLASLDDFIFIFVRFLLVLLFLYCGVRQISMDYGK